MDAPDQHLGAQTHVKLGTEPSQASREFLGLFVLGTAVSNTTNKQTKFVQRANTNNPDEPEITLDAQ